MLSAQQCVDCAGSDGCTANLSANMCLNEIKADGISTSDQYPYTGTSDSCKKSRTKSQVVLGDFASTTAQSETEIIQLINYGPVIASVDASQSIF